MVNKRVLMFGIFVVVGLLVVSLVSAKHSFWHVWGEEPREAPFDAEVTLANSAPTITSWTEPDFDTVNAGLDAWPPTSCGTSTIVGEGGVADGNNLGVVVTVTDANTDSDLNAVAVVDIIVQDLPASPTVTHLGSCSLIVASIDGDNDADFRCTFDMDFHDAQAGNWVVEITATDDQAAVATNDGQQSDGGANYPYFTYGSLFDIDITDSDDPTIPLDTLSWSGIQVTSTDVVSTTNLIAQNCGNGAILGTNPHNALDSYITVRGRDLANAAATDLMEPDTFSVDETAAPCNVGQRFDDSASAVNDTGVNPISVLGINVPTGAAVTDSLYFCLEAINQVPTRGNSPITADSYSSTNAGNSWEVNACETSCASDVGDDV